MTAGVTPMPKPIQAVEADAPMSPDQASPDQVSPDRAASDLATGRAVLRAEAAALSDMAEELNGAFISALDILIGVTAVGDRAGRIIVSGMGKSGHIGRKIAATFASTGTPANAAFPVVPIWLFIGSLLMG